MKYFASKKDRIKSIKTIIILCIIIAFIIFLGFSLFKNLTDIHQIKETIQSFGIYGPLAMIAIMIIIHLFGFITQIPIIIAGGFTFGIINGAIYSIIGFIIGGAITFFIARKLGRPFVIKVVSKEAMTKFNNYDGLKRDIMLFIFFLAPLFPDAMCYVAGLTNIKYSRFLTISVLGRIPAIIVFSLAGKSFANTNYLFGIILILIILIFTTIIIIYRTKIEDRAHQVVQKQKK